MFLETQKPRKLQTSEVFYSYVLKGGLILFRLIAFFLFPVQPFADIVGYYTCHNRDYESVYMLH